MENKNCNKEQFDRVKNLYLHNIPVDIIGLANALGIKVYEQDFTNDTISGYISRDNEGYYISVNKNHPATRKQFTIAHEIGHFVLHQHYLERDGIGLTYFKNGTGIEHPILMRTNFSPQQNKTLETEANRFAAEILMPAREFIKAANECDDLNELARKFYVSVGAASIRANSLGIEIY